MDFNYSHPTICWFLPPFICLLQYVVPPFVQLYRSDQPDELVVDESIFSSKLRPPLEITLLGDAERLQRSARLQGSGDQP
jgi:hypothetical protein